MISNVNLEMRIEEKDNPESNIDRVVTVINNDPRVKIEVLQDTFMEIKEATNGSIVIHLCPLTDNAVHRFLSKDGTVVQNMVEMLFSTAELHNLLREREEIEIIVKIREKESAAEEKGMVLHFYSFLSHFLDDGKQICQNYLIFINKC